MPPYTPAGPPSGQEPPVGPGAPKTPVPGQGPAIGILIAGAVILFSLFSKSWVAWHEGGGEGGGLGPLGGDFCGRRGECQAISWAMLESPRVKMAGDISLLGTLAMIGGLAAAAIAIWMGVSVLTRKRFTLPEKFIRIGFGVAASGMSLFLMRLLTADSKLRFDISYGGILGIGALVAAYALYQKQLEPILAQLSPAPPPVVPPAYVHPGQGGFAPPAYGQQPGQQPSQFAPPAYGQQPGQPPSAFAPPGVVAQAPQAPQGGFAAPSQSQRPCPRCQRLLTFVPQYQREFCDSCQQYM